MSSPVPGAVKGGEEAGFEIRGVLAVGLGKYGVRQQKEQEAGGSDKIQTFGGWYHRGWRIDGSDSRRLARA